MPRFRVNIAREYAITEGFERIVEAPDAAAARQLADSFASRCDMNCPDDCLEIDGKGASDFRVERVEPYHGRLAADDLGALGGAA